ncbi:MAG TPA: GNAT family N-acetyltransferase [Bryobacteraceae bacterium]|nr:GNAT family N-acetyltransferase [Bryobacteraceae bacterium]
MTSVYEIDPLEDPRWAALLEEHPSATIFHSPEWLRALKQTYGYQAAALTTSNAHEPLTNALVFCRVRSWATGPRLVSVPFSDHCFPLVETAEQFACLLSRLKGECDHGGQRHLEIRASGAVPGGMVDSASFCLHRLDLRPSLGELFRAFHESCIRRKIARAQREHISYEEGVSQELLHKFYQLTVLTRRRHQVPPQPLSWFRNLLACMGDKVKIRLASYEGEAVAAILTLRYKSTMTYKYGCSDSRFHRLGPMQLLMWKAIQEAKDGGLLGFDMGRTDWNNHGLMAFKDRWGGTRSTLTYLRYPAASVRRPEHLPVRLANLLFTWSPNRLLTAAGNILYRHID